MSSSTHPPRILRLAALGLSLLVGCESDDRQTGRGVLVVVVDGLRSDHISAMGYDRETTPRLDALREESIAFDAAWSASPTMVPAHAAILTGCDPLLAQRPRDMVAGASNWFVPASVPRLAIEFAADGWMTAAFADHPFIGRLRGFDRGFVHFTECGGTPAQRQVGLAGVGRRFVDWISDLDQDRDWFAYMHMNDLERMWTNAPGVSVPSEFIPRPELDYIPACGRARPIYHAVPPARWHADRTLAEYEVLYDAELRWFDRNLQRIFDRLKSEGRWEQTTVVIVGSYGIGFGESDLYVDNGTLSDVDLHVPFLVRPAPELGFDVGKSIAEQVGLIDVAPTLLAMMDIAAPRAMHGQSLLALMRGDPGGVLREYTFSTGAVYDGFAVTDDRYSYVFARHGIGGGRTLISSWFGLNRPARSTVRETLKDRESDRRPGHSGRDVDDTERAARMRAAGEAWYEDVRRAQRVVHLLDFDPAFIDADELSELRRKGLVP
ncbi:MAG: sulfatase [bacterium]|nr:sulfatase [bacterium]